jgi:hypothetical protein
MIDDEVLEELDYDPGLLNDYGGGNVDWWMRYIRSEINSCNSYWRSVIESHQEDPLWVKALIKLQDKLASESDVFAKILKSERTNDIQTTNHPKAKTRNAIMIRQLYETVEIWERELLMNDFYKEG